MIGTSGGKNDWKKARRLLASFALAGLTRDRAWCSVTGHRPFGHGPFEHLWKVRRFEELGEEHKHKRKISDHFDRILIQMRYHVLADVPDLVPKTVAKIVT